MVVTFLTTAVSSYRALNFMAAELFTYLFCTELCSIYHCHLPSLFMDMLLFLNFCFTLLLEVPEGTIQYTITCIPAIYSEDLDKCIQNDCLTLRFLFMQLS